MHFDGSRCLRSLSHTPNVRKQAPTKAFGTGYALTVEAAEGRLPLWGLAFVHSACLTSSEDIKIHQNASRFMPIHPSSPALAQLGQCWTLRALYVGVLLSSVVPPCFIFPFADPKQTAPHIPTPPTSTFLQIRRPLRGHQAARADAHVPFSRPADCMSQS